MSDDQILGRMSSQLAAGKEIHSGWITIPSPHLAFQLAQEAYDMMIVDMQHGPIDFHTASQIIGQVMLAGKPTAVRIPVGDFALGSQLLDSGAVAIIAPMINSGEEARAFASFLKYPPLGDRSWGPAYVLATTGNSPIQYLREANAQCLAIAMIETKVAVDRAEDIIAAQGIDGIFVGPNDLLINMSGGRRVNEIRPEVDDAMRHVAELCKKHGKVASSIAATVPRVLQMRDMGYQLLAVGTDTGLAREATRSALQQLGNSSKASVEDAGTSY